MAYMDQQRKAKIAEAVKPILKQYGLKGTLSVRNYTSIVLTIKSGAIDFIGNFNEVCSKNSRYTQAGWTPQKDTLDVNPYWYHEHFTGQAKECLAKLVAALKVANWYDRSDAMTDHFDTAYFFDIRVGKWNKPYKLTA